MVSYHRTHWTRILTFQSVCVFLRRRRRWDAGTSHGAIQRYAALGSSLISMSEPVSASRIECVSRCEFNGKEEIEI